MVIRPAQSSEIERLTELSKEAFDSDIYVGNDGIGGPPDYDNKYWHKKMAQEKHLYSVYSKDELIGGAVLFNDDSSPQAMVVGRIFVDPQLHHSGFGMQMMRMIEAMFPNIKVWKLDTPIWNVRTNNFYKKLGYVEMARDNEFVYYQKEKR